VASNIATALNSWTGDFILFSSLHALHFGHVQFIAIVSATYCHVTGALDSCAMDNSHNAMASRACRKVATLSNPFAAKRARFNSSTAAVQSARLMRASNTLCSAAFNVASASSLSAVGAAGTATGTTTAGICGASGVAQPAKSVVNRTPVYATPRAKGDRDVRNTKLFKNSFIVNGLALKLRLISLR
jgi:hypothetical protein